jgi:uncharacterized protein YlaI
MPKREKIGRCLICEKVSKITEHHLHPIQTNGITIKIMLLCDKCHKGIHKQYTNKELDKLGTQLFYPND